MAVITVIINKQSNVRKTIRERYRELYQGWKRENPNCKEYTLSKLNANIRNVLSVNGKSFNEQDFRPAAINKWSGRKVLPFAHWYFLVRLQADLFGKVYAIVEDACYEGDYHNDIMNTNPYGESIMRGLFMNIITENKIRNRTNTMNNNKRQVIRLTESDLHNIISESVKQVLSELDWKTYANAAQNQMEFDAPKPKGMEYHGFSDPKAERAKRFTDAARDAFQRDYGNPKSYTYSTSNDGQFGYTQKIHPNNDKAIEYRSSKDPNRYGVRDVKNHGVDMFDDVRVEQRPQKLAFSRRNNEYDDFKDFDKMDDEYKSMQLDTKPKYRENPRAYIKGKGWQ